MANNAKIGIFDSGVGGLTVARALADLLPKERFLYFGDTAHLPYGEKSAEAIVNYSFDIGKFLLDNGAKALVIACNSASAVAFDAVNAAFGHQVPVINVIDPVVQFVAEKHFKNVGIIGTRATVKSNAYKKRILAQSPATVVNSLATPLLVPVIEEGLSASKICEDVVAHYLAHDEIKNIEALILGCTHYPILHSYMQQFMGAQTQVINSPKIVANAIAQALEKNDLLAAKAVGEHAFFVSDFTETFEKIAIQFFDKNIGLKEHKL